MKPKHTFQQQQYHRHAPYILCFSFHKAKKYEQVLKMDAFNTEALSTSYVDIVANKRAVSAMEFEDLVDLQSQLGDEKSEIRSSLVAAVAEQINDYLYTLVSPSAAAPQRRCTT